MIEEVGGDLLTDDAQALVNPVNCVGVMGKGLAAQFKQAFPEAFPFYRAACKTGDLRPGRVFPVLVGAQWVLHFPTKRHWRDSSWLVDVETGLDSLVDVLGKLGIRSVAVPPLGCGLGGLDWADVRPLIHEKLGRIDVDVRLYVPTQTSLTR